jgi:hypothetical protein
MAGSISGELFHISISGFRQGTVLYVWEYLWDVRIYTTFTAYAVGKAYIDV